MIVATQDRPIGIALIIVKTIETLAKWLFWSVTLVATSLFVLSGIDYYLRKKHEEIELNKKNELEVEARIRAIEKENQCQEEMEILEEKKKYDAALAINKEQERRSKEEQNLKIRSAEDAVNEAFRHFM